jgi:hypothetical protein
MRVYYHILWPRGLAFNLNKALRIVGFSRSEAARLDHNRVTRKLPRIQCVKLGPHSALLILDGERGSRPTNADGAELPPPFRDMEIVERAEKLWVWCFQGEEP